MSIILKSILKINPTALCSVQDEDINKIIWLGGTTPIPKADIETKMVEVQAEYDALEYSRKRQVEYPSIADQLDYIYHNGVTKWKTDMITPVKEKYPKPD